MALRKLLKLPGRDTPYNDYVLVALDQAIIDQRQIEQERKLSMGKLKKEDKQSQASNGSNSNDQ